MRSGVILELGSELCLATSYDEFTGSTVVVRGFGGTSAVAHTAGDQIKLSPPFPRRSVFEAIADNIIGLYPDLYTVQTALLSTVMGNVAAFEDDLAVEIVEIWPGNVAQGSFDIDGRVVDFHPAVGSRAVILDGYAGTVWVKYRRRFGEASSEDDTLEDLGVEERWGSILMVGACADLFAGRDLPASQTEWVANVLKAENIRVGTRAQLSASLAQYRGLLVDRARSEMRGEYKAKVRIRTVSGVGY